MPPAAEPPFDIEQPACFYLGREYDIATGQVLPDKHVMYDARDLTTHGVVVGMTGSGKTGLGIIDPRRGRHRRHPLHHHRPQGRPVEPPAAIPRPRPARLRALAQPRGRPPEEDEPRRSTPATWPSAGGRGWPTRTRSRSALPCAASRRSGASTRPAARPACRCRSSAASPPRRASCRARRSTSASTPPPAPSSA